MDELTRLQTLIVWAPPVLLGVTLHEVAHGWVASRLGDRTAALLGRLSLNPIKHVDPVGTLLLPGLLWYTKVGVIFGWAKPVPVNWANLRHPRRDMALVALAGPFANLLMVIAWLLVTKLALILGQGLEAVARPLFYMGEAGISINTMLMIFNLLPVPPLDGSRVLAAALPEGIGRSFQRLEPYGLIIVMLLLLSGMLGKVLDPGLELIHRFTQQIMRW